MPDGGVDIEARNEEGATPLRAAAKYNKLKAVALLPYGDSASLNFNDGISKVVVSKHRGTHPGECYERVLRQVA